MTSAVSPAVPNTGGGRQQSRASACQDPNQRVPGHSADDALGHNHQEATLPLVEYVNDAIAIVQDGKTVYRNPAYLRLLGQSAADRCLGTCWMLIQQIVRVCRSMREVPAPGGSPGTVQNGPVY
jgi:PAS domain-containing protein